jgi:hypothetical protein
MLLLAALSMVAALVLAPPALAQEDEFDCADFASQEEAQAVLDQDTSDPSGLDADSDGIACEELPTAGDGTDGGTNGGDGTEEDLDCDDFATQAEAQAVLDADTSDPNNLDGDADGIACEVTFGEPVDGGDDGDTTTGNGDGQYDDGDDGTATTGDDTLLEAGGDNALPDTGGLPLVPVAAMGALLLLASAGLLVSRR